MCDHRPTLFGAILVSVLLMCTGPGWCRNSRASEGFPALLEEAIRRTLGPGGPILLSESVGDLGVPRFRGPIKGLDGPEAVPFLIEVLEGESDWATSDRFRNKDSLSFYIARCYAALNLGVIGDRRALEPLVNALAEPEDDRWRRYSLTDCAALGLGYLRDPDAVDPLLRVLPSRGSNYRLFAYALALLGDVRAIRPLIQHASRQGRMDSRVHLCLQDISHAKFDLQRMPEWRYRISEFPELGELESDKVYLVHAHD